MTKQKALSMGFYHVRQNRFILPMGMVEIPVFIDNSTTELGVMTQVYEFALQRGKEAGKKEKAEQLRQALYMEE